MRRLVMLLTVCVLGAATAWAANPSAPTPTTGGTNNVTPTSAVLIGTVNPGGADSTYSFQYGTSSSYGLTTPTATAPASTSTATVTATITSLTPVTTYHYRLTATNAAGANQGNDATFTTPVAPAKPSVGTGSATSINTGGATLNGTIKPNALPTTYVFQYGTSSSYGSTTPSADAGNGTSTVNVKQDIGALKSSTTYHYRLVGTNSMGAVNGSDHSFRTAAAPSRPKPSVATGSASKVGPGSATLNARVNPNGVASTYVFQYGPTTAYGSTTPSQNAGSGKSSVNVAAGVGKLAVHTTYHFRVVATNANGTTTGSDQAFYTASGALSVTLSLRPDPVVYGHGLALVGSVNGAGGGIPVTLHSIAFPFTGAAATVGNPQLTAPNGSYRFVIPAATVRTRFYTTATLTGAALTSPTVVSRVRVRVGLMAAKVGGHKVKFSGTVTPGVLGSTVVAIQRRSTNGSRWLRVTRAVVLAPSQPGGPLRFAKRVRIGTKGGVFRAVALPNDGNAHTRNVSRSRTVHFGHKH